MGRPRGGLTTEIPVLADARGSIGRLSPAPRPSTRADGQPIPARGRPVRRIDRGGVFDTGWLLAELDRRKANYP